MADPVANPNPRVDPRQWFVPSVYLVIVFWAAWELSRMAQSTEDLAQNVARLERTIAEDTVHISQLQYILDMMSAQNEGFVSPSIPRPLDR